ncbi:MAG: 16S rRNA (uracil(1498)-N(3))-methyltransferase, partial [Candidatus Omnitrophota bacterium]
LLLPRSLEKMSKFFVPAEAVKGNIAVIKGKEAHHITRVMRLREGERISAFDGSGKSYQGIIKETRRGSVTITIESAHNSTSENTPHITLIQALPKKEKIDYIIEKCTELGIDSVIPVTTERTIVKLSEEKAFLCQQRWQKIALAASKQCGRTTTPVISKVTLWTDILDILEKFELKLIFCLDPKTQRLKDVLRKEKAQIKNIAFLIGPEGDFSPQEIEAALSRGCLPVSLGELVLKVDTAAIAALAMLNYELQISTIPQ